MPVYAQAVNKRDSLALVDLYNSTNGPHWFDHTNWLTKQPVKKWFGIEVTSSRVTKMDISGNNLNGSIPSSIGNLVNLNNLALYSNQLSGSIPPSIGNLVNLIYLDLSYNQLSGAIPSSLGNLVNLSGLYLSNNKLSGSIPSSIGNIVNLDLLDLKNNKLSGKIPSSFANFASQPLLYLQDNLFTFTSMEFIQKTFLYAIYAPQAHIPIHQNGNALSVSAGGTLSHNTYKWFRYGKTGNTLVATIKGDSVFHPTQNATYFAKVTNSVAIQLTLQSDTIHYAAPAEFTESTSVSSENALQRYNKTNLFLAYPNPCSAFFKKLVIIGTAVLLNPDECTSPGRTSIPI